MGVISQFALAGALALLASASVQAQQGRPAAASMPAATDSLTKIYTYVQYMPLYKGREGTELLTKDLRREFKAASVAAGCVMPTFPVIVDVRIGPSGVIHDVMSINNLPLITQEEFAAGVRGIVGTRPNLQPLPAACEAALLAAGRRLPRMNPGSINGRRVSMSYTLKLVDADK